MKIKKGKRGQPKKVYITPIKNAINKCHHKLVREYLEEINRNVLNGCPKQEIEYLRDLFSKRCEELKKIKNRNPETYCEFKEFQTFIKVLNRVIHWMDDRDQNIDLLIENDRIEFSEGVQEAINTYSNISGNLYQMTVSNVYAQYYFLGEELENEEFTIELTLDEFGRYCRPHRPQDVSC